MSVQTVSFGTADGARFATGGYKRINGRRLEHLASLELDLSEKTVLEVGAGIGDHTTFFLDRDCKVLSVEARPENCEYFVKRMKSWYEGGYLAARNWVLRQADVNKLGELALPQHQIVYAYGILYHLADPALALKLFADACGGMLLLETCVSPGDDIAINPTPEQISEPTQSIEGMGCRPTRPWIFRELAKHFAHVYMPLTQPAHEHFPRDWTVAPQHDTTRAVFIASRQPIDNPRLSSKLLSKQRY